MSFNPIQVRWFNWFNPTHVVFLCNLLCNAPLINSSDPPIKKNSVAYPIYKGTLKSFFLSRIKCSCFCFELFICGFCTKVVCACRVWETFWKITELDTFPARKKDIIVHVVDQIKVPRALLWIELFKDISCRLCRGGWGTLLYGLPSFVWLGLLKLFMKLFPH